MGTIAFVSATAVPPGIKSTTYLWVPDDNSTLSSLPLGLQRYTGEQDFVLVEANVDSTSGGLSSVQVPEPWGTAGYVSSYAFNGAAENGMVNFLIPRGQFLDSPFGQAVMEDSVAQYPSSSPPPLPISGGDLADSQGNGLECYWQTRSVQPSGVGGSSGTDPALCGSSAGGGTSLTSPDIVRAVADTTGCSGLNCGGVPLNPMLEASMPSPALQAVVTLNLSSQTELVNLLAGLLDNSSGGVNGTLELVTPYVSSLGLNAVVVGAMANVAQEDSGIYGIPTSLAAAPPPSPPSCSNFVGCAWNAVSGVVVAFVGTVVDGIEGLAGEVWDATIAITAYFSQMAAGLASVAEKAVAATVAAMKAVGGALVGVLDAVLAFISSLISSLLSAAFNLVWLPLKAALDAFTQAGANSAAKIVSDASAQVPASALRGLVASSMAALITGSVAIAVVIAVAVGITAPESIGVSFLIGLLITIMLSAVGSGALGSGGVGFLGEASQLLTSSSNFVGTAFTTAAETAFNATAMASKDAFSTSSIQLTDPTAFDWFGYLTQAASFVGFGVGGLALLLNPDLAGIVGLALGALGLLAGVYIFLLELTTPNHDCTPLGFDEIDWLFSVSIYENVLAFLGIILSILGIENAHSPTDRELAGAGLGFGVVGFVSALVDVGTVLECTSTGYF